MPYRTVWIMDNTISHTVDEQDTPSRIVWEAILLTKNVIKALFISIFRFFVSPTRKCVKNKIVLITGSGGCMGRQLSLEFSKLGAILVLWDVCERDNEETAKQIREQGGKCHTYNCDVGNADEVYRVGDLVKQEVGDVDILVNNAGVVTGKSILECPDDMVEKTFNVNLLAHFWTVKCFLPAMMRRNSGHIVNVSSSSGLVGVRNLADYSASKFGVVGLSEVLNYEIVYSGYTGVHTSLVCPSFINTRMFGGCKIRFPMLLSSLELDYCVERIMQGILTNQTFICIPRLVYFMAFMKTILPVEVHMEVQKFFGAANFMDNFGKRASNDTEPVNKSDINGHLLTEEKKLA